MKVAFVESSNSNSLDKIIYFSFWVTFGIGKQSESAAAYTLEDWLEEWTSNQAREV